MLECSQGWRAAAHTVTVSLTAGGVAEPAVHLHACIRMCPRTAGMAVPVANNCMSNLPKSTCTAAQRTLMDFRQDLLASRG
eukprot:SAG31_NODE_20_length_34168_cov_33.651296_10_plen_81_part_00